MLKELKLIEGKNVYRNEKADFDTI